MSMLTEQNNVTARFTDVIVTLLKSHWRHETRGNVG